MKLQDASRKELTRISVGVLICDGIMIAALFILSLLGIGRFTLLPILLGAAIGSLVAIGNFALLCLTVQNAADTEDQKIMKRKFQLSYNLRLTVQAVWIVLSYVLPGIHFVAGALPTLFPNIVIYYLQIRGKLVPQQPRTDKPDLTDDDSDDRLESFEV